VGAVEGASGGRVVGGGSVPRNSVSTARSIHREVVADITIRSPKKGGVVEPWIDLRGYEVEVQYL